VAICGWLDRVCTEYNSTIGHGMARCGYMQMPGLIIVCGVPRVMALLYIFFCLAITSFLPTCTVRLQFKIRHSTFTLLTDHES
jgi:hypothetical protein